MIKIIESLNDENYKENREKIILTIYEKNSDVFETVVAQTGGKKETALIDAIRKYTGGVKFKIVNENPIIEKYDENKMLHKMIENHIIERKINKIKIVVCSLEETDLVDTVLNGQELFKNSQNEFIQKCQVDFYVAIPPYNPNPKHQINKEYRNEQKIKMFEKDNVHEIYWMDK